MIEVTGANALTIEAAAGETYCITYETNCAVDISNQTDGQIYISDNNDFTVENGIGKFIKLAGGTNYNGYRPYIGDPFNVYIYTEKAGNVSVIVKGW